MALRNGGLLLAAGHLASGGVRAQPVAAPQTSTTVVPPAWYRQMLNEAITTLGRSRAAVHRLDVDSAAQRRYRFSEVGLRTPSLDRASAASAVELASASVRTSLDGVEAGVSIAPVALLGAADSPHQLTVSLAALDERKARYAIGYNYQTAWLPTTPVDLDLPRCSLTPKAVEKLEKLGDSFQFAYGTACQAVLDWRGITSPVDQDLIANQALYACTQQGPIAADVAVRNVALDDATRQIETYIERERAAARMDPARWEAFLRVIGPRDDEIQRVITFDMPSVDCYKDDEIDAAWAHKAWSTERYRVAAAMTLEQFSTVWGFNPEPGEPLPEGQAARWEGRVEAARLTGPFEAHLGVGVGRSRPEANDAMATYVAPSLSIAIVIASLSGDPLYANGRLNALEGAAPPRLVLGMDGELQYTFRIPDNRSTHLSDVEATAFLDFIFTDKIGFRIGVPLRGELVTRKAETTAMPPVTERTDIQWSIPVMFTTVLKL